MKFLILFLFCMMFPDSLLPSDQEWLMSGKEPGKSFCTDIRFSGLKLLWTFDNTGHTWEYRKRMSVWSENAVIARAGGKPAVFSGSYDHNVYSINAENGKLNWKFPTGLAVNAAPVFFRKDSLEIIIVPSTDRVLYAVNAANGEKIWSFDLYPWTFTVFDAVSSSPVLVNDSGFQKLISTAWYADNKAFRPVQKSEVFCLNPENGQLLWRTHLGSSIVYSPACDEEKKQIAVCSDDGKLYLLNFSGTVEAVFTSTSPMTSPPVLLKKEGNSNFGFSNLFGVYYSYTSEERQVLWKYKLGMQSIFPGAFYEQEQMLFIPCMDRTLHCVCSGNGQVLWKFETEKYLVSSPVLFTYGNEPALAFPSLDNKLYILKRNGEKLCSFDLGDKLFAYDTRGWTFWPSPSAACFSGKPIMILPWYDGKIYAYSE